jgi:hypothetical protein
MAGLTDRLKESEAVTVEWRRRNIRRQAELQKANEDHMKAAAELLKL